MAYLRSFMHKLRNFLRPGRAEQDLTREIDAHLALLQDEFQRRGLDAIEARSAALRAFGGIDRAKELHRDERSWVWPSSCARTSGFPQGYCSRVPDSRSRLSLRSPWALARIRRFSA